MNLHECAPYGNIVGLPWIVGSLWRCPSCGTVWTRDGELKPQRTDHVLVVVNDDGMPA